MNQSHRLNNEGLINRNKEIVFKFNGKKYIGYEGCLLYTSDAADE